MAIEFDVTNDINKAIDKLSFLDPSNIAYAAARAMTLTGQKAQVKLKAEMLAKIDRPTPWTMGGTFVSFASPKKLEMEVGLKNKSAKRVPAGRYLQSLIKGGQPTYKGVDLSASKIAGYKGVLVPAKDGPVSLNKYGNVSLNNYAKVLSGARDAGRSSRASYFMRPVKRGSSIKAIYQRKTGFIGRTSTLQSNTVRVFTLDPNPKQRTKLLDLPTILGNTIYRDFPIFMKQRFEAEVARKLSRI